MAQTDLAVGSVLKVCHAEPATYDEAGYAALTWLELDDVVNVGAGGGSATVQSYVPLKTGITVKRAGQIEYQDRTFQLGRHVQTDTTHQLIKSGFDGAYKGDVFSWAIHYPDNSIDYFTGTITSFTDEQLEANSFMFSSVTIAPTTKVITKSGTDVFTVTYAAGSHGSIIGDAVQYIESGDSTTYVYASAAAGYHFTSWSDASTTNPRRDTSVVANHTFTATFVAD